MKTKIVLAIDLGAESGRVMAVHFDGSSLQTEELHRFPNIPVMVNGTLHWNILQLWHDILTGVEKGKIYKPASLGVDTWAVDFALLDKNDELIGNPVHYRDTRTEGIMDKVFASIPKELIFEKTGIQFLPFNTIFQLMSLIEKQSDHLSVAKKFLTIPDLLNFWFTGEKVCEFSNATTTQLYNPTSKNWDFGLMETLGIPKDIFPEIVLPGTKIGEFDSIPVIAPACHDTGSAVAAVPTSGENFAYISSGTWSLVGIEVNGPIISHDALDANITNEGGVNNTYRLLKNVMGLWIVQQCRKTWQKEGDVITYAGLTNMADNAKPLNSIINPNDLRFLGSGDHPKYIQDFCRQTHQKIPCSKGEIVRCVLESLACAYRETIENIELLTSKKIQKIHIVGGGTQNTLLNQMTADVCNLPVVAGPVEATVIGNALVQFISLGEIKDLSQGRELVGNLKEIKEYQPENISKWKDFYSKYKKL